MTSISHKLIAGLATIAMFAPAAGAQAATQHRLQPDRRVASYQPARHHVTDRRARRHAKHQSQRSTVKFIPDTRNWG